MKSFWAILILLVFFLVPTSLKAQEFLILNGDVNCSEEINITDAILLLTYLFLGGDEPCEHPDPPHLTEQIESLLAQLAESQEALQGTQDELAVANDEITSLQDQLQSLQTRVADLEGEVEVASARISELEVPGCTDPEAANYDCSANVENGSCQYPGCIDPEALNYDEDANIDDGSCRYIEDELARLKKYELVVLPYPKDHDRGFANFINNSNQIWGKTVRGSGSRYENILWNDSFQITELNNYGEGLDYFAIDSVNDLGQAVGNCDLNGDGRACISDFTGKISLLPQIPNQHRSSAMWINDFGIVSGETISQERIGRGVIWAEDQSTYEIIESLEGDEGIFVHQVTSQGHLFVKSSNSTRARTGLILNGDSSLIEFSHSKAPEYDRVVGFIANENGQVIGFGESSTDEELRNIGLLWDVGKPDEPAEIKIKGDNLAPRDMNKNAQIILDGALGPYVYGDGVIARVQDLLESTLGFVEFRLMDINDAGYIVGRASKRIDSIDLQATPILLVPTDEYYENP